MGQQVRAAQLDYDWSKVRYNQTAVRANFLIIHKKDGSGRSIQSKVFPKRTNQKLDAAQQHNINPPQDCIEELQWMCEHGYATAYINIPKSVLDQIAQQDIKTDVEKVRRRTLTSEQRAAEDQRDREQALLAARDAVIASEQREADKDAEIARLRAELAEKKQGSNRPVDDGSDDDVDPPVENPSAAAPAPAPDADAARSPAAEPAKPEATTGADVAKKATEKKTSAKKTTSKKK